MGLCRVARSVPAIPWPSPRVIHPTSCHWEQSFQASPTTNNSGLKLKSMTLSLCVPRTGKDHRQWPLNLGQQMALTGGWLSSLLHPPPRKEKTSSFPQEKILIQSRHNAWPHASTLYFCFILIPLVILKSAFSKRVRKMTKNVWNTLDYSKWNGVLSRRNLSPFKTLIRFVNCPQRDTAHHFPNRLDFGR